jgi:CRP/FNR family transcriptional regulator, cyclic AMP receptor protein
MREILSHFKDIPKHTAAAGEVLLDEGQKTGRLYVLAEGRLEVLRGGAQIAVMEEPGSIAGEMSVLLDLPHTGTVRALGDARVHVVENGADFLRAHPELAWLVARLLARRLNAASTYLVDLKRQFSGVGNHLELVGELLESMMHEQGRGFQPGSDRDPGLDY